MSFSQKQIEHTVSLYAEPFSTRTLLKCNYLSCIFPFSFSFNPRSSFFSQEEQNSRKKSSLRRDSILVLRSNFWNEIYTRRPHTQTKKKHSLSTLLKRRLVCIVSREFLKNSPHPLHSNHHPACIKPSLDGPEAIRLISIESSVQADSSRRFRFDRSRAIWTRARLPAASQTMHLLRDRLPRECLNNDRGKLVNGHRSKTFEPFLEAWRKMGRLVFLVNDAFRELEIIES